MCESGTHASHSKEEEEEEEERKKGVLAKSIFKSFPPKRLPGPLVKPLFIPSASVFDKTKQHNSQKQRRPERGARDRERERERDFRMRTCVFVCIVALLFCLPS
jgi:hypothetical protein